MSNRHTLTEQIAQSFRDHGLAAAILPLVPYLDTLRWMFIALALGGIAVAVWARLDDWRKGRR
jgi:hypothetical protein